MPASYGRLPQRKTMRSSLYDKLVGAWPQDEQSGLGVDLISGMHLADLNTVTVGQGKLYPTARQYTAANGEALWIPDNELIAGGDNDFTVATFVNFDSFAGDPLLVSKYRASTNDCEYCLFWWNSNGLVNFLVCPNGQNVSQVILGASTFGTLSTGVWYLIIGWHDSVNNTINIQVNNTGVNSQAHTTGVFHGTSPFVIGASGQFNQFFGGRQQLTLFWRRVLTSAERSALWRAGNGVALPFVGVS